MVCIYAVSLPLFCHISAADEATLSHRTRSPPGIDTILVHIKGTAFLWHQVRCLVAILTLVGEGKESPDVVASMLDLEATPRKPQYKIAPEKPLLLSSAAYDGIAWYRGQKGLEVALEKLVDKRHEMASQVRTMSTCGPPVMRQDPSAHLHIFRDSSLLCGDVPIQQTDPSLCAGVPIQQNESLCAGVRAPLCPLRLPDLAILEQRPCRPDMDPSRASAPR